MRKGFNFYQSYYEAGEALPPEARCEFYEAIIKFQFTREEPEFTTVARYAWVGIKHSLEKQVKGYEDKTGETLTPRQGPTQGPRQGEQKPMARGSETHGKGSENPRQQVQVQVQVQEKEQVQGQQRHAPSQAKTAVDDDDGLSPTAEIDIFEIDQDQIWKEQATMNLGVTPQQFDYMLALFPNHIIAQDNQPTNRKDAKRYFLNFARKKIQHNEHSPPAKKKTIAELKAEMRKQ